MSESRPTSSWISNGKPEDFHLEEPDESLKPFLKGFEGSWIRLNDSKGMAETFLQF